MRGAPSEVAEAVHETLSTLCRVDVTHVDAKDADAEEHGCGMRRETPTVRGSPHAAWEQSFGN